MSFKKVISIFMVLTFVLSILCTNAFAESDSTSSISTFQVNQNKSLESYQFVRDNLSKKYLKATPDYYAGSYLDSEGNLVFNLANSDGKEIKDLLENSNIDSTKIKFNNVKYSLSYLEGVLSILKESMVNLGISATELDEQNNKIYIYLDSLDKEKINKINNILKISDMIEFKKQELVIKSTATTTVKNGTSVTVNGYGATIGFAAKETSTGKIGFVIPGHMKFVASVGDTVKYNGSNMGKISNMIFSGGTDACFVTRNDTTWKATKSFMNGDAWSSFYTLGYTYPQNTAITAYEGVSGKQTGVILSNDFSYTYGGTILTSMCKSSYKAIEGDSGGAVCTQNSASPNDNTLKCITGMQSASALNSDGSWGTGCYSIFSKITNITSDLGVKPYSD